MTRNAVGQRRHNRPHGFDRTVTSAAAYDGAQLERVVTRNTGSKVWADTAYRSKKNEAWLLKRGFVSDIHRKKPQGRPMSERTARANRRRSMVRSAIEHVFARQKGPMGLFVRTIGIVRAKAKIGMANLAYNLMRFVCTQADLRLHGRCCLAERLLGSRLLPGLPLEDFLVVGRQRRPVMTSC